MEKVDEYDKKQQQEKDYREVIPFESNAGFLAWECHVFIVDNKLIMPIEQES